MEPDALANDDGDAKAQLMLAILLDALDVLTGGNVADPASRRRLVRDARRWFSADDVDWPLSFVNVCGVLGLNASRVRAWLADRDVSSRGTSDREESHAPPDHGAA